MDNKRLDTYSINPNDKREKALQRAIIAKGKTYIGSSSISVEWLDIELPVRPDESHRIDLIGKDSTGRFVLCELKFSNGSSINTPSYAENELIGYWEDIKANVKWLTDNGIHHSNGKNFDWAELASSEPRLIVAANASYWVYWLLHRNDQNPPKRVECCWIDISFDYYLHHDINDKDVDIMHWGKI